MNAGSFDFKSATEPFARASWSRLPISLLARLIGYLMLIAASIAILIPFAWMVVSSLKRVNDVFTVPIQWIPDPVQWSNYTDIFAKADMITWIQNTLILSVAVTFLQVLTGSLAAYGFSRGRFPGRRMLFLAYVGTIAVPWQAYMIPQFILFSKLHLANTLWSIIALQAFGAFGVFLMKVFYDTIPIELTEAARIDGLSEFGIYRRIMLPLSIPAIASLGLLTFVTTWNDYLGPLLYLRDPKIWTIQLGLQSFVGQYDTEFGLIMTGAVISVLPVAIIFALGQRYFIEGIATTGVKG
jgi:multiple sugar transport system permease protein